MASLGFTFEARFFAPVQPEDCPALDTVVRAPTVTQGAPPLQNAPQQAPESVDDSGVAYREWKAECKRLQDQEDELRERFYDVQRRAREAIQQAEDDIREAKLAWHAARDAPRPGVPKSKRRK